MSKVIADQVWKKIVAIYRQSSSDRTAAKRFRKSEVVAIELQLQRSLPDSVHAMLKAIGAQACIFPDPFNTFAMAFDIMAPEAIFAAWLQMTESYDAGYFDDLHKEVRSSPQVVRQWWCPGWIPIATNGGGDFICVDLNPTYPGTRGQLVVVAHEVAERPLLSTSLGEFAKQLLNAYENSAFRFDDRYGMIRTKQNQFPCLKRRS